MERFNTADKSFIQMETQIEDLRRERKKDTDELHARITIISREVSALMAETDMQTQRLASIDSKLDRLIERRSR